MRNRCEGVQRWSDLERAGSKAGNKGADAILAAVTANLLAKLGE